MRLIPQSVEDKMVRQAVARLDTWLAANELDVRRYGTSDIGRTLGYVKQTYAAQAASHAGR